MELSPRKALGHQCNDYHALGRCGDNANASENDSVTTPRPPQLISHRFELSEIVQAYHIFGNASKERAVKVAIKNTILQKH